MLMCDGMDVMAWMYDDHGCMMIMDVMVEMMEKRMMMGYEFECENDRRYDK